MFWANHSLPVARPPARVLQRKRLSKGKCERPPISRATLKMRQANPPPAGVGFPGDYARSQASGDRAQATTGCAARHLSASRFRHRRPFGQLYFVQVQVRRIEVEVNRELVRPG